MSAATNSTDKPTLTLFRGWKDPGRHVWSPFVIKLEARLRFAGIKYAVDVGSPRTAPKGKVPYVEFGNGDDDNNKEQIGDSGLIIKTLVQQGALPDLNAALSGAERARDLALRALLEDKLYFYHMWERWIVNYYAMRDHILQALPYPVRVVVGLIVHRGAKATLHGQGTGRYGADEIAAFRREIWESINELLLEARRNSGEGKDPFWVFGGGQPSEADAALFGFIVSVLISTAAPDSQRVVKEFPVIIDYAERIQDQYFPDYEKWSV